MPERELLKIHEGQPYIALRGYKLHNLHESTITGVIFGRSEVSIRAKNPVTAALTPAQLRTVILASPGLRKSDVAQSLFNSFDTVHTHLHDSYRRLDKIKPAGFARIGRPSLPRLLFAIGMYGIKSVEVPRKPLLESERAVVDLVSRGYTNKEIALLLDRSPKTVKTHLAEIAIRYEWNQEKDNILTRTATVFQALLNGDISFTPLRDTDSMPPLQEAPHPTESSTLPKND